AAPLRAAYDLLVRALTVLKEQGREAVRDSDVKRRMLELEPAFDEASLGFGKFTRFLRQAHDHEVVTLNKQEGGNYEVSLGGRAAARGEPSADTPAAEEQTAPQPQPSAPSTPVRAEQPEARAESAEPTRAESASAPATSSPGVGPRRGS